MTLRDLHELIDAITPILLFCVAAGLVLFGLVVAWLLLRAASRYAAEALLLLRSINTALLRESDELTQLVNDVAGAMELATRTEEALDALARRVGALEVVRPAALPRPEPPAPPGAP